MMTRKDLEGLSAEEVKALRDGCEKRHFTDATRYWNAPEPAKKAYRKEYALLDKYYKEIRDVSDLEKEFLEVVGSAKERMEEELSAARKHLYRAIEISEETGIPMEASISELSQTYWPESKFSELDEEILQEFEIYDWTYNEQGWEHSAVC